MPKSVFSRDHFTAMQHTTQAEKARYANALVKFMLGGFKRAQFTKMLYRHLSNSFGHIAHYNEQGFYDTWFDTAHHQTKWVQHVMEYNPCGSPEYTRSDVEREIKLWLSSSKNMAAISTVIHNNHLAYIAAQQTEAERLAALLGKSHQDFMVVAKSNNTNAFGHYGYVLVAADRSAYQVSRTLSYPWTVGQVIHVPLVGGKPNWSLTGVECPMRLKNATESPKFPNAA